MNYERLLLDHLDLVDQIVRTTGRRRHLSASELEDLTGFVRLRLVEDDYAILRKFQHRSSFWTYLATVIERLSIDYCADLWGRWRPSAMADRLGPVAILLERLVSRDGHSVDEAIELARTNHGVDEPEGALRQIWAQLPVRGKATRVPVDAAAQVPATESAEAAVDDAQRHADIETLERALADALARCTVQERLVVALRFSGGLSMTEIAQVTGSSAATLHRRLANALRELRASLESAGVSPRHLASLIGHDAFALSPLLHDELERLSGHVRLYKRDG